MARPGTSDEPHLSQISAHLLRGDVGDPENALVDAPALDRYEVRPDAGLLGRLYVKPGRPSPPPWQEFLGAVAVGTLDDYRNEHASAVLFIDRGGRTFALTFGFGRHLLDAEALEPDFGLKVAAGLVDPSEMNAIDSRLVQSRRLQVRRQAGRGATTRDMGIDVGREMVRAMSGRVLDDTLGTRISGADALGLAGRTDVATLLTRLDRFLDAYERKLYQQRFPVLDRWLAVSDRRQKADLDAELVLAVARGDKRLGLGVPEIVDWRAAGFRFSREPADTRHPFPEMADYLKTLGAAPEIKDLRRDHLTSLGVDSDEIVGNWSIYRALEWETQHQDRVFFLADGRWYEIDADFLKRVDSRLDAIDKTGLPRPDFDPREHEVDYNKRLAVHAGGRATLDRQFAYFEDEAGKVEICDVFTAEREFVHIKRDFEADALSHLFAQGAVSAELFTYRPEYRARLRDLLAGHPDLVDAVPVEMPEPGSFRVAFGIISEQSDRVPADLPVFSRVHLAQMADLIERLGFRITVFGISTRVGARPAADGPTERELRVAERARATASSIPVPGAARAVPVGQTVTRGPSTPLLRKVRLAGLARPAHIPRRRGAGLRRVGGAPPCPRRQARGRPDRPRRGAPGRHQERIRLDHGQASVVGRRSPLSLYDKNLATYDEGDAFDHAAAVGFIEIFGLPLRVEAARHGAVGKHHGAAWTWTDPLLADLPSTVTD